jgi:predicted PurR-regulated permease PerM
MPRKIEISHRTIIFTVVFLIFLWFLYYIRDIIFEFYAAILIMAILNPTVSKLSKYKIPRALSVSVVYLFAFGLVAITLAALIPPLIDQTSSFVNGLPGYLGNLGISIVFSQQVISHLVSQIGALPGQLAKLTVSVFSNVLGISSVLIFAFYLLLARDKLDNQLGFFFDNKKRKEIGILIDLLEERLGGWARGQLSLMLMVGVSTYIGLRLLGIPFSLPLAILAGLLEIIPYIGPIIAAIPLVIIGFGISVVMGLATAALAFLIQQLENYVFVPKVMEKSVGVNPIITLLSLAIGFKLAGIIGVLLSLPIIITIQVLTREYFLSSRSS